MAIHTCFFPFVLSSASKLSTNCPQMGYFGEQNNSQPSIQNWGVCCFSQVARTAAQHCMARVRKRKLYFLLFKLAKCQSRPFGQNVSTNFVADCSSSLWPEWEASVTYTMGLFCERLHFFHWLLFGPNASPETAPQCNSAQQKPNHLPTSSWR